MKFAETLILFSATLRKMVHRKCRCLVLATIFVDYSFLYQNIVCNYINHTLVKKSTEVIEGKDANYSLI